MKKKISIFLGIMVLLSIAIIIISIGYLVQYTQSFYHFLDVGTPVSDALEVYGGHIIKGAITLFSSLIITVLSILIFICINKADLHELTSSTITSLKEKRAISAERKRQAKLAKAQKTIDDLSSKKDD